ncbi:hypothetical protein D9758_009032 [Tetrapyrgos nigripes]|uniref:Uncharacterized protein n=1 Tax=Tetrapyrgos nigripes TaxID=182062 RepID=A0A8H5GA35_9AGAR|nr:hypothetical protein D9758_009032 [Tetrapyrgos nigripes]
MRPMTDSMSSYADHVSSPGDATIPSPISNYSALSPFSSLPSVSSARTTPEVINAFSNATMTKNKRQRSDGDDESEEQYTDKRLRVNAHTAEEEVKFESSGVGDAVSSLDVLQNEPTPSSSYMDEADLAFGLALLEYWVPVGSGEQIFSQNTVHSAGPPPHTSPLSLDQSFDQQHSLSENDSQWNEHFFPQDSQVQVHADVEGTSTNSRPQGQAFPDAYYGETISDSFSPEDDGSATGFEHLQNVQDDVFVDSSIQHRNWESGNVQVAVGAQYPVYGSYAYRQPPPLSYGYYPSGPMYQGYSDQISASHGTAQTALTYNSHMSPQTAFSTNFPNQGRVYPHPVSNYPRNATPGPSVHTSNVNAAFAATAVDDGGLQIFQFQPNAPKPKMKRGPMPGSKRGEKISPLKCLWVKPDGQLCGADLTGYTTIKQIHSQHFSPKHRLDRDPIKVVAEDGKKGTKVQCYWKGCGLQFSAHNLRRHFANVHVVVNKQPGRPKEQD